MNEEEKYTCNGCKYQFKDHEFIYKIEHFNPPSVCYGCYIWAHKNSLRKGWQDGEKIHFSCDGCVYKEDFIEAPENICNECCELTNLQSHRKNWRDGLFLKEIKNIIDSIDEI